LLLLLLANRRKMRREAEAETEGDGAGVPATTRRQIRPDCGRRNRGMDAVAEAMAASANWRVPVLGRDSVSQETGFVFFLPRRSSS
jgi:hypothetical protein